MKRLARPSCFLFLVLSCMSVAASLLLFDNGVAWHNIFVSTFMLATRLNRTVGYVVFNFISIVIFLGFLKSSKPINSVDIDGMFFVPPSPENVDHEIEEENKEGGYSDDEDDEYHGYDGYEEDNEDDMEAEDDEDSEEEEEEEEEEEDSEEEEEEEGDIDLERRSEEFIAKMNSKWREELLHERLLCMVYASAPKLELL
ncbi:hypothetical protein BT93_E1081 [Corymbia citriodora subsp. variegata]|nr:hypothetical protein BT93_E1081 [Corymbia citriodora subsp. variegata]